MYRSVGRAVFGGLVALFASEPVLAADLPVSMAFKASPITNWTGFYAGANAGYTWGDSNINVTPGSLLDTSGFASDAGVASVLRTNGADKLHADGFTGGVQIGYNWQMARTLIGIEADFDYLGLNGSASRGPFLAPGGGGRMTFVESIKTSWLATVRPRIGYLINPSLLVYATGGLAIAQQKFGDHIDNSAGPFTYAGSVAKTQVGWAVGAGLEHEFARAWTTKIEYLYVDLGAANATGLGVPGYAYYYDSHLTANIVRAGINYRLGDFVR